MPEQVSLVTPQGLQRIERELERLRNVTRPRIVQQLKEALEQASAQASPLENPDYAAAKNEQAFVEGRIMQLEAILNTAVLIETPETRDVVSLGTKVTITESPHGDPEHYWVVGSVEADPLHGYISNESPLGKALLGHKVGDQVTVHAPAGEIVFIIQAVE
jgi:transcription elongation factor GreA